MNGKGRTVLLYCGSIMVILALVMSLATVSQAKQQGDQHGDQQGGQHGDQQGGQHGHQHDSSKKVKVPEPSTSALLILGIGLTGLAGYCWRRRKRGA